MDEFNNNIAYRRKVEEDVSNKNDYRNTIYSDNVCDSWCRITTQKINLDEVLNSFNNADGRAGALVVFTGTVRNFGKKGKVMSMYYECYNDMAENQIKKIEDKAKKKWDIKHIRVIHRVGNVELGDISIVIAVLTPHSYDAFQTCRFILKKIKQEVPIWKKEILQNGQPAWVDGVPL